MKIIPINDIKSFEGTIPEKFDLVCYEASGDPMDGMALYGFDEVGDFDSYYIEPTYCFLGTYLDDAEPTYCHINRPYGDI
jgi:hypothetical protein|tara:strand:+ start:260 stop:499 length:240 start_codon:yes stop_codon:yes gene_type:complete